MMTKKTLVLLGLVLLKFFLQYSLISPEYDLQRDEYLHLDQANHLAWGYLSVPPATSWVSVLIQWLGNQVFWVKFFPALFGALTMVVVWKTIQALNGSFFAQILGAVCALFSVLLRLNTLFQPNSLDVLCWTAFFYTLVQYIAQQKPKWLFFAALVFTLGLLNKYNLVFLAMGLLPALLLSPQRAIFRSKHCYMAAGMALLLVLPNLLWQYQQQWPVVHHLKELAATQLVHVHWLDFLKNQLLFFSGALLVILLGLYALLFYLPFKPYRFFALSFVFTLLVFMYCRAKDYYAIGLYPVYIAFGSVFTAQLLQHGWLKYLRPLAIGLPLLLFIPFYQIGFPNKSPQYIIDHAKPYKDFGLLRWEDGKEHALPQDFADMLGWRQLAKLVDSVFATLPNPGQTLVLCDNYGQTGAINYYKNNPQLIAHSFNADYINWLPFNNKITDAILVKEPDDEDKERNTEKPLFDTVYMAARRINVFAREDTISIYVLRGAKVDINQRLQAEAEAKRRRWQQ